MRKSKYLHHVTNDATGKVFVAESGLFEAGQAAGSTAEWDASHRIMIKELFGENIRYNNLSDKSRFKVYFNGHTIERTPRGEKPTFKYVSADNLTISNEVSETLTPNGQTFHLSDHAIERLEERFPDWSTQGLHQVLGSIGEREWKWETWDANKGSGTAKASLEDYGMKIIAAKYPTKWVVITVESI